MKVDVFTKWVLGIMGGLMTAGVIGIWSMSTTLARIDEKVAFGNKAISAIQSDIKSLGDGLADHRVRITILENKMGITPEQKRASP